MTYFASNSMKDEANHNKWYQSSSDPRELLEARAETAYPDVSRTLVVMIEDVRFPITIEVLHCVFDQFGAVEDIEIYHGNKMMQALVRFQVLSYANSAKIHLDGRCIFDGCCFMHIQFLSEINSEELLDQSIAIMRIYQALLDMKKEMSVGFQKIRGTLFKPRNVRKNTIAPTILLDKTSVAEFVHTEKEVDKSVGKEASAHISTQVFDEMLENSSGGNETLPVYDDEPVYDVYDDETENCAMQVFDVAIDELKRLGVSEKVDLGHSLTEVHELKVFDEMFVNEIENLTTVEMDIKTHETEEFEEKESTVEVFEAGTVKVFDDLQMSELQELELVGCVPDIMHGMIVKDLDDPKLPDSFMDELEGCNEDVKYNQIIANENMLSSSTIFILLYEGKENTNADGYHTLFSPNNHTSVFDVCMIDPGGNGGHANTSMQEGQYSVQGKHYLYYSGRVGIYFIDPGGCINSKWLLQLFNYFNFENGLVNFGNWSSHFSRDIYGFSVGHLFDNIVMLAECSKSDSDGYRSLRFLPSCLVFQLDKGVQHKKWGHSGFNILIPWQNAMSSYTCKNKLLGNSQTDMAEKDKKFITWGNVEQVVQTEEQIFHHL